MTATEAKWTERVRDWQAGGRTAEQYAEGQGFKPSTLRFWASRLRSMAKAAAPPSREPVGVQLVRVRRVRGSGQSQIAASASAAAAASPSAPIVIAIGAVRIEVQSGFNRALLGEIVAALGSTR